VRDGRGRQASGANPAVAHREIGTVEVLDEIEPQPGVHFIAADFARETLGSVLARSGLDPAALVFFSWLGVTSYLTREANRASLSAMAASAPGSLIAFSYLDQVVFAARAPAGAPEGETLSYSAGIVGRL